MGKGDDIHQDKEREAKVKLDLIVHSKFSFNTNSSMKIIIVSGSLATYSSSGEKSKAMND